MYIPLIASVVLSIFCPFFVIYGHLVLLLTRQYICCLVINTRASNPALGISTRVQVVEVQDSDQTTSRTLVFPLSLGGKELFARYPEMQFTVRVRQLAEDFLGIRQ